MQLQVQHRSTGEPQAEHAWSKTHFSSSKTGPAKQCNHKYSLAYLEVGGAKEKTGSAGRSGSDAFWVFADLLLCISSLASC